MGKIVFARVDFRLIHGQVITKWTKAVKAEKIIIVDDALAKDSFLAGIYVSSAPKGVEVLVNSVDEAAARWREDQFGDGKLMVLFKNIASCKEALNKGFSTDKLNLGGAPNAPGKKKVTGEVFISPEEKTMLQDIRDKGVEISIQAVPEKAVVTYDSMMKKL